ncbi:hypothetical protein K505DRAFT_371463 [Melanomma pulvis-pyrius CBS 109.77]|uniref:Transcription initiation factor TFIID subunit 8 n=1 Tax=Melanomma pulvis-pyrius CBS 109.77 TaxID=1314802 RepID=A0A6A6XRU9_9PLEO|nr:hypothetical protein K505DRAFT_371463 [Melanomma pulvis-pyrius CBS 109.77]
MPGLVVCSSAASVGAIAGMKRAHAGEATPAYGEPHPKKRKVVHRLHITQPIENIIEHTSGELDTSGESKDFFDHQLRRAIALQCKCIGIDSARPEVLEMFRGLVDSYMRNFLSQVQKSMNSARRTESVGSDWVYALNSSGITGSSLIHNHLDTGNLPPSLLQPSFAPPEPPEQAPPDLDGLLGPELSGKADKESKKYIPSHFPPFPSRHTWKSTPVFTERENDPRKIREKATEEGILAEQSLRKLMAAQKKGLQKMSSKVGKRKRSKRMVASDMLWVEAMKEVQDDEDAREEAASRHFDGGLDEDSWNDEPLARPKAKAKPERKIDLEGVHVNYDQKFWRKSARGS